MPELMLLSLLSFIVACSCVTFTSRTAPGVIPFSKAGIIEGEAFALIDREMKNNLPYAPQTWFTTFHLGDPNHICSLKLVLVTRESDRVCSLRPSPMRISGTKLISAFRVLVLFTGREARAFGYGHISATLNMMSLEYITYYTLPSDPVLDPINMFDINYEEGDCDVFGSGMASGERGSLGSELRSGSRLVSANGFYDLVVETDCNLVLYALKWKVLWSSDTAGRGGGFGCSLTLQRDGNLVLLGNDGRGIFAADVYCQPQPYCVFPTVLVVEDSGHLSLFRATEPMVLLWRRP